MTSTENSFTSKVPFPPAWSSSASGITSRKPTPPTRISTTRSRNTGGDTQPVTIKSGDTLSAISLLFYGNANKYPQIAKANNLADPNNVPIGTTLQLPVITS